VGHGHHWCGNAESYFLIGDALGKGIIKVIEQKNLKSKDRSPPPAGGQTPSAQNDGFMM